MCRKAGVSSQTQNKSADRGEFFDVEKRLSKNHKNALNHHELTTKNHQKTLWKTQTPTKNARRTEENRFNGRLKKILRNKPKN
jgi:hypothetical protein